MQQLSTAFVMLTGHNKNIHNFVFIKYYLGDKTDIDEKRNELSDN
jgi:hypothetical protein